MKPGDELMIALAPIIADLLTGLPLRVLGVSSLIALYSRRAVVWVLGAAASGCCGSCLPVQFRGLPSGAGADCPGWLQPVSHHAARCGGVDGSN
ncbi:MAG: hypothetical protein HC933_12640, partial [Pleurocapsa sp. SU_196_0]|nr:hypothetical protein [Pleurocapsa sp. SU_196_0]